MQCHTFPGEISEELRSQGKFKIKMKQVNRLDTELFTGLLFVLCPGVTKPTDYISHGHLYLLTLIVRGHGSAF